MPAMSCNAMANAATAVVFNLVPQEGISRAGLIRRSQSHRTPGHLYAYRNFILDRHGEERRTVDLEIGTRRRNCSGNLHLVALRDPLEWDMLIVSGLAGKLDLQIGINRGSRGCGFGKLGAHDDH